MANVLSEALTARDANTYTYRDTELTAGALKEVVGVVSPAADQSASDFLMFVAVPSNAIISQVMISAADASTGGAIDVGIFEKNTDGTYSAVDDDLFASALDLAGGPYNNLDITHESGEYTYAETEKPLWEVLGLTTDPKKDYIVASDITTVFNGGPTSIKLQVRFRQ